MLRRNDHACNSPDCLITATGLAKSFASCLRTAGSRLESRRANSSSSKGKSEKAAAGLRHGHFCRIHRRKRSNIVGPTLAAILESLNVIDVKRFRCGGIRPEILGLHRYRQLASEAATESARAIVGGTTAAPYRAGSMTLQLVRPDIRQSCILLAEVSSCANHNPTTSRITAITNPAIAGRRFSCCSGSLIVGAPLHVTYSNSDT
jgi:hypothetical protein